MITNYTKIHSPLYYLQDNLTKGQHTKLFQEHYKT